MELGDLVAGRKDLVKEPGGDGDHYLIIVIIVVMMIIVMIIMMIIVMIIVMMVETTIDTHAGEMNL